MYKENLSNKFKNRLFSFKETVVETWLMPIMIFIPIIFYNSNSFL